jgi:NAD+ synthase (glutamine-hydrolysing)
MNAEYYSPEEEIAYGPAAWLWDYLRRSGATGFLLPLSGGADSAATATIVGVMCHMVMQALASNDARVAADVRRICNYPGDKLPTSATELANKLLTTCYLGTVNSSKQTQARAASSPSGWWLRAERGCTPPARGATTGAPHQLGRAD